MDHPEAGVESSLAQLGEWFSRTCVDVPPETEGEVEDMKEENVSNEDEGESEEREAEEGEEKQESSDNGGGASGSGDNSDDHQVLHAALTDLNNLWENGQTITYTFFGPAPLCGTLRQQKKVIKVLTNTPATWTDYANIKFKFVPASPPSAASSSVPVTGAPSSTTSNAMVRIQFIGSTASWSQIGKQCETKADTNEPTMNLGWIEDDNKLSDTDRGVILHEFGHVLGLVHEHQSPTFGGVITLKESAVKIYFNKLTEKQIDEQILKPYLESELTNFTEFDPKSIMLYFMPKELNNERIDIKPINMLSKFDKAFVALHYPFFGPDPPPHEDARIENALRVLGIAPDEEDPIGDKGDKFLPVYTEAPAPTDEEKANMQRLAEERQKKLKDKEAIMQLYRNGDWAGIRKAVKKIYAGVREERMKEVVERMRALAKKPASK